VQKFLYLHTRHPCDSAATLLDSIFRPRIRRHQPFKDQDFGLEEVLGKTPSTNNELAWQIRKGVGSKNKSKIYYHGKEVFVGLWTSDICTMVEMFNDMLLDTNGQLTKTNRPFREISRIEAFGCRVAR
jgi:hypothetical protein